MANLGHNVPVYSMPITRDYSIDERTNRIVNEFLMHDPTLDDRKNNNEDNSHRGTASKRHHHHRIRPKTFDETTTTKNTLRKHSQHQYPSVHLPDSIEQEEGDSSDATTPLVIINPQPTAATRREISMATGSPSIIITGDDSGS